MTATISRNTAKPDHRIADVRQGEHAAHGGRRPDAPLAGTAQLCAFRRILDLT
jgi:hypothetical protein